MSNTSSTPSPATATPPPKPPRVVGMLVFEGFELLDVFGPLELFGMLRNEFSIVLLAEQPRPVRSNAGPAVLADRALSDPAPLDVLLIPGGWGTRREVKNAALLTRLNALAETTPHVGTICTGSALLARSGALDGRRATTNKRAFAWVATQGPAVTWIPTARWVEDGKFFTSSGVSAGMDMTLALIAKLLDRATAERVAQAAEYTWHDDAARDPFAALNGL